MAEVDSAQVPTEFGRQLRACIRCTLLKTYQQFLENGCENCPFLSMENDESRVVDCSTPNFSGMISVIQPNASWAAKWLRLDKFVPGCYALQVTGDLPDYAVEELEDKGIAYTPRT